MVKLIIYINSGMYLLHNFFPLSDLLPPKCSYFSSPSSSNLILSSHVLGFEGEKREREVLLHFPAICQMAGGMDRVYLSTLCSSLDLDPSS